MDKDKENNIIIPTREEFEDFCSLKLGYWAIIVLLLIFNIVMSSWIVTNNYKNDL